jgi:hypothetical protein
VARGSELDTQPVALCINGSDGDARQAWEWRQGAAVALAVDDIHAAAAVCRMRKVRIVAARRDDG